MVVFDANVIPPLVQILQHSEFDVKKAAARAIFYVTSEGSQDHIRYLAYEEGCIKGLCDLLSCPDPMVVSTCLEGLENILRVGEADKEMGVNVFVQRVHEYEGWDKIEIFMNHWNNEISQRAVRIVEEMKNDASP
ncbi:Importin subunit alpha-1 [Glycine soja]|nr:Importin subunit alpha-1 [Glycine soja]